MRWRASRRCSPQQTTATWRWHPVGRRAGSSHERGRRAVLSVNSVPRERKEQPAGGISDSINVLVGELSLWMVTRMRPPIARVEDFGDVAVGGSPVGFEPTETQRLPLPPESLEHEIRVFAKVSFRRGARSLLDEIVQNIRNDGQHLINGRAGLPRRHRSPFACDQDPGRSGPLPASLGSPPCQAETPATQARDARRMCKTTAPAADCQAAGLPKSRPERQCAAA